MNALEWKVKWILVTVLIAVILAIAICMFGFEREEKNEADISVRTSMVVENNY